MRISDWSSDVCSSDLAGELLARVLVVAAVPAEPVALGRLPRIGEVFLLELLVADQVDVADLGRLAFLDRQGHVDAVAVELAHRGGDLDVVLAAIVVLAGEFLGEAVEAEAVEGLALGQADVGQALEQNGRGHVRTPITKETTVIRLLP